MFSEGCAEVPMSILSTRWQQWTISTFKRVMFRMTQSVATTYRAMKTTTIRSFWVISAGLTCQKSIILLVYKIAKQSRERERRERECVYEALRDFQILELPSATHILRQNIG